MTRRISAQARLRAKLGDLSGPGFRAFFSITTAWGLSDVQQRILLGGPPAATYFRWKRGQADRLPRDVLERISYILGIYKALQVLIPDEAVAGVWMAKPNFAPMLGGMSALDRMLAGNVGDLYAVRQYLDAQLVQ